MKLIDIFKRMKPEMNEIEKALEQSIDTDHVMLHEASLHLLRAGGKRIRPIFVLLAGEFGQYDLSRLKHVAVSLELIHMATLVHDDVIDDAATRRGQLTVKSKWDNRIAMYTGDYIFAKALSVSTELQHPELHRILSNAIVQMCIGEMEQIRFFFHTEQTIRDYLLRIRRKTALLIAISCQLGALAAGAEDEVAKRMYTYGYNVGMAFQIRDDLLDICGTEKVIGKPPGSDIRQGNITLPIILSLRDRDYREQLLLGIKRIEQLEGEADVSSFITLLKKSRGIEEAERMAGRYIEKSIHALEGLPDLKAKRNLQDIAHFVGNRSY